MTYRRDHGNPVIGTLSNGRGEKEGSDGSNGSENLHGGCELELKE